jgi:hypothetical protein
MTNLEGRIIRLELLLKASQDYARKLEGRVSSLEQQARQPLAQMWQGGGGGEQIAFWTKSPTGGIVASTGDWPAIAPETFVEDVYKDVGGTLTLEATGATIRWFFRDPDPGDRLIPVIPNGDGTYDARASSCTAVVT